MRIGLTGSIAAGKSTVSKHLCELGAHVLDADFIAREIVEPGTKGLSMLRDAFGEEVITPSGALDRAAMAARVFGDPAALKTLNAITHPLVVARMAELSDLWEAQHPTDVIVWDMALLIECGAWERMDAVWLITAPETIRLARVMQRDGCTRTQALARMAAQMPEMEKRRYATEVIVNDSDEAALFQQVDRCYLAARAAAEKAI